MNEQNSSKSNDDNVRVEKLEKRLASLEATLKQQGVIEGPDAEKEDSRIHPSTKSKILVTGAMAMVLIPLAFLFKKLKK